jgi:hypothetical protein
MLGSILNIPKEKGQSFGQIAFGIIDSRSESIGTWNRR